MFVIFCLDLEEQFLFTQEVCHWAGNLSSRFWAQISEDQREGKQKCLNVLSHTTSSRLIHCGGNANRLKKALRFKTGHIWKERSRGGYDEVQVREIPPSEHFFPLY